MKFLTSTTALTLMLATLAAPAFANSSVTVKLWDKGGTMDMSKNMGMGMGMHGNMTMAVMGIKATPAVLPQGKVTFKVTNISTTIIHEMLVAPIANAAAVLPFIEAENRADETKAGDLGEVSELDPGKSGELSIVLKPGLYILFCNVPGHYAAGMWTTVTVK